jgi:outer membrane lipase/esterase
LGSPLRNLYRCIWNDLECQIAQFISVFAQFVIFLVSLLSFFLANFGAGEISTLISSNPQNATPMKKLILALLIAVGLIDLTVLHADTSGSMPYSAMVIFGDSVSDSGNNALAIGAQTQTVLDNSYIPTYPYAPGTTYCNGEVWASYAAAALGLPLLPSLQGGLNYAYGGATTGTTPVEGFPPSLMLQATQYFGSNTASSTALYVIEGGGNDARAAFSAILATPENAAQIIQDTATSFASNIATIATELKTAGAQHIIVWDAPNLGIAPAILSQGELASQTGSLLANQMNVALATALNGISGVSTFNIYGLGSAIGSNPGAYGFTNATDAGGAVPGANPDNYAFWDGIHPTTAAHKVIADAFVAQVIPEPSTYALFGLGAIVMLMVMRRKRTA